MAHRGPVDENDVVGEAQVLYLIEPAHVHVDELAQELVVVARRFAGRKMGNMGPAFAARGAGLALPPPKALESRSCRKLMFRMT